MVACAVVESTGTTFLATVGALAAVEICTFGVSVPDQVPLTMMPTVELLDARIAPHCAVAVTLKVVGWVWAAASALASSIPTNSLRKIRIVGSPFSVPAAIPDTLAPARSILYPSLAGIALAAVPTHRIARLERTHRLPDSMAHFPSLRSAP